MWPEAHGGGLQERVLELRTRLVSVSVTSSSKIAFLVTRPDKHHHAQDGMMSSEVPVVEHPDRPQRAPARQPSEQSGYLNELNHVDGEVVVAQGQAEGDGRVEEHNAQQVEVTAVRRLSTTPLVAQPVFAVW